ncbi:triose-phosphate transporter family-domain-containing protein [Mrakia frigida]|uniref:triose-phosphate transporter family-domain-containing protein n=1 Tax=Mrakia frigida TaxID=29902 RepID=UPI003FCBF389
MATPTTERMSYLDFFPVLSRRGSIASSSSSSSSYLTPSDLERGPAPEYSGDEKKEEAMSLLAPSLLAPYTPPPSPPTQPVDLKREKEDSKTKAEGSTSTPTPSASTDLRSILPIWCLSLTMGWLLVMSNKYILSVLAFPYPIFLTTSHMAFAVIGTRLLKIFAPGASGMKIASAEDALSWKTYSRTILPIGVLFSASLILSNSAVLLLSVSLVQMLKAFIPASILLISALFKMRKLDPMSISVILIISFGCALAAYGEVRFSLPGFLCQLGAVLSESLRLVLIQVLLQGQKVDPLTSLYHYAPVCFSLNLLLIPLFEGTAPFVALFSSASTSLISPYFLLGNAFIAFSLNILALVLIQKIGGLALSLAGIVKDIALILGSGVVFGNSVTGMQVAGYGVSIIGLWIFRFKTPSASS